MSMSWCTGCGRYHLFGWHGPRKEPVEVIEARNDLRMARIAADVNLVFLEAELNRREETR